MNEAKTYSLSPGDLTSCWRGVYYKRKEYEKPDIHPEIKKTLDFFRTLGEKGTKIQNVLTQKWKEKGVLIVPETWLPNNQWNIKGKFDAICDDHGTPTLVEIKGASDKLFQWYRENKKPITAHSIQCLTYYMILKNDYPGLVPKIIYVNRKTGHIVTLDVDYSEENLQNLSDQIERMYQYLHDDELPPAAANIEERFYDGTRDISMTALTCRYHNLCTGDDEWYVKTMRELGREIMEEMNILDGDEVPF